MFLPQAGPVREAPVNSERWARIKEILREAQKLPDEERRAYLESACRGDAALRDGVERLLAETFELGPGSPAPAPPASRNPEPVPPGQTVNAYRVLERLGAGGFGVVYRAVDSRLGRHVALSPVASEPALRVKHPG